MWLNFLTIFLKFMLNKNKYCEYLLIKKKNINFKI